MALIDAFVAGSRTSLSAHPTKVTCTYSAVEVGGQTLMQLDTHGSADRQYPGKISQTLQIDKQGAAELVAILTKAFFL